MSNFENLKECLTLLTRRNPILVQNILKLQENQKYQNFVFCNTSKGELNLFFKKKLSPFMLHDSEEALKESKNFCQSLNPQRQVLFIFGTGLGYSFLYLKKWLEEDSQHHLVYLEPHLGVLFHLFQTDIGKKMTEHPRVHLYRFERKSDLNQLITYLGAYFSHLRGAFGVLPSYKKAYPFLTQYLSEKLIDAQTMTTTRLIETKASSSQAFTNFLSKFPHMSGNINASRFNGLFKNIPCIICGAGPSLKKNLSLLKTLKQNALILAGSSAVPALNHAGMTPHFATFFDPYYRVHKRLINSTSFELPTFHCARTYFETSRWIHGPKLYTKGSDDLPFVDWMENELGFEGQLVKEWISVTSYNTSIAMMMGCNPIIYVGVDLAYTGNELYMAGIQKETSYELTEREKGEEFEFNEDLWATDIYGEPILTRFGWQAEAKFLRDITRPMSQTIQFINATEGGIGIPKIPNCSLKEVQQAYLGASYPFEEWIHSVSLPLQVQDPQIEKKAYQLMKEFKKSLIRVQKQYRLVLREAKRLQKLNKLGELKNLCEDYLLQAEKQISEEMAYQYYLTHHQQVVDIENLKTHHLFHLISPDAPEALVHEINLRRVIKRYQDYLDASEWTRESLERALKKGTPDPWQ